MSPLMGNEARIEKDWRQAAITSTERIIYTCIVKHLSENSGSSTYMMSRAVDIPCARLRKYLRQMEKRGYVTADSNGFNNINWSLKP